MRMPYQCLERCGKVLVAASGSRVDSFNIEDGSLLSTWKCPVIENSKSLKENKKQEVTDTPPAKRRKLSSATEDQEQENEKNEKKKASNTSDAVSSGLESPAVIALTCTKSGGHVIAVTGEDKSIRVFEHDGIGHLKQLSQRAMPKRPCAITITEDDSTIISADKFGDVYSIPLIPSEPAITELTLQDAKAKSHTPDPVAAKPFVPAANDLTVHSVRNRKALENQKKQTNKAPERTEPTFEHKLLLGHVSMLTDITLVTLENRNYIITADRDEHIRISRGIPQSHIIEGFCLGHTEFISRLCVPKDRPELLISGGGEDELYVWNWLSGELLFTADIKSHLATVLDPTNGENATEPKKPTVSGIYHTRVSNAELVNDFVTVICEGVPALFIYELTAQRLGHSQTVILPGNVLAVSPISTATESNLITSVDTIHKAGSTTERRDDIISPLITYTFSNKILTEKSLDHFSLDPIADDDDISEGKNAIGRLTNLLYNLENLRKRDGGDKDEE